MILVLLSDPPMQPHDDAWRTDVTLNHVERLGIQPIVLLGDFGLSTRLQDARTVGIGTFMFTAPVRGFFRRYHDTLS